VGDYYERSGTTVKTYYYPKSTRVAMNDGGVVKYLFGDHPSFLSGQALGSMSIVTDASGNKLTPESRHKAWGEASAEVLPFPTTFRFTSQRQEMIPGWVDGLDFYNSRWYDPSLGRFIQPDSMIPDPGNPLDYDRYAYVRNAPTMYTDPSGHNICDEDGNCYNGGNKVPTIKTGTPPPAVKRTYKPPAQTDPNLLKVMNLYRKLNFTSGWWNDCNPGSLTVQDFFALMLAKELSPLLGKDYDKDLRKGVGATDFVEDLTHGTAHWFYSQAVLNGYGKEASDMAILSFLANGCSGSTLLLYNQITSGVPINVAMNIKNFNLILGQQVMEGVVNPTDPEWKVTGLNSGDPILGYHPGWWGNPGLMGKPIPTSFFWKLRGNPDANSWYLVPMAP
jgi:RHS repeat-associated protein